MMALGGVHHVGLTVSDLDRSEEWYVRLLGLTRFMQASDTGLRMVVLRDPEGELALALYEHASNDTSSASEFRCGLDHLSIGVSDRLGLLEWMARLDEHGVPHSPINDETYGSVLVFRDPDNIQLEFFCPPSA
jgi:catechol 2,3-dioxygenase-like lactoylglutathione lyase family enzyme